MGSSRVEPRRSRAEESVSNNSIKHALIQGRVAIQLIIPHCALRSFLMANKKQWPLSHLSDWAGLFGVTRRGRKGQTLNQARAGESLLSLHLPHSPRRLYRFLCLSLNHISNKLTILNGFALHSTGGEGDRKTIFIWRWKCSNAKYNLHNIRTRRARVKKMNGSERRKAFDDARVRGGSDNGKYV